MNYKLFIKNCIKNNYKGKTIFNKNFIKIFKIYRKTLIENPNKFKNNFFIKDNTFRNLEKIYNSKNSNLKEKKTLVYYKKFEANLALKSKYSYKFKKLDNKETNCNSYIYLGLIISNSNSINIYQKLNCILKIIDKISNVRSYFKIINYELFIKLLILENKLLKKIGI